VEVTLEDIGPVIDPDEAIRQLAYPRSKWEVKKWISAELRRGRTAADVAADLRSRAEKIQEAARAENPQLEMAHRGLLAYADRVEANWDPWVDGD